MKKKKNKERKDDRMCSASNGLCSKDEMHKEQSRYMSLVISSYCGDDNHNQQSN